MKKRRGIFTTKEAEDGKAPRKQGVYFIFTNKYFPRLKGKTNIIYIGRGVNLYKRLIGPRKALPRFNALRANGHDLTFRVDTTTKAGTKKREKIELNKFEKQHLELPPLNHSG